MKDRSNTIITAEEYINSFPADTQALLRQMRTVILENATDAEEGISYNMPAYKVNGTPLVYFAAFTHHIGFYATPSGHAEFARELSVYKQGKGSVQFPFDKPLPLDLIARIVRFRVEENLSGRKRKA